MAVLVVDLVALELIGRHSAPASAHHSAANVQPPQSTMALCFQSFDFTTTASYPLKPACLGVSEIKFSQKTSARSYALEMFSRAMSSALSASLASAADAVQESNYGTQISKRAAGLLGFHQVGDVVTIQLAASNDSTISASLLGTTLKTSDVCMESTIDMRQIIPSSRNTPITAEPLLPYSNNRPEAFPVPAFVDYNTTFNISYLTSLPGIAKVAQVGFPALGTVMSDWKRVIREKLEEVKRSLISSRRPNSLSDSTEMPSELKVLLTRGDLYAAERYLNRFPWRDRHTDMINRAWIQELLEMGHSKSNVAELLMG
ncbi:hypothetical protein IWZ03DRAFT_411992 [Phyllosticta citriasiana]|uniref:Uncharacterized protein n=1 Tax=Phyllosticta citriasiana TaxID=595635 RepID=A0ABR1KUE2_9PEZI